MIIEHLFRILKGMWKILQNPIKNLDLKRIPSLILACCLLYNIVIDRNDLIDKSIIFWRYHNLRYRKKVVKNVPKVIVNNHKLLRI